MIYVIALRNVYPLGMHASGKDHLLLKDNIYPAEVSKEGNYKIQTDMGFYYDRTAFRELTNVERLVRRLV